jgi:hypothetical protein
VDRTFLHKGVFTMRQGLSASLLALVVTFGTVVGAQLGRDSVAEVKPLFFSDLPDPPAIIDDQAAAPMQLGTPAIPQGISWGYPYEASARPVCWGCPEQSERFGDPASAPIPTSGHAVVRRVADIEVADEQADRSQLRAVERYMSYPIAADEARRAQTSSERGDRQGGQFEQTVGM